MRTLAGMVVALALVVAFGSPALAAEQNPQIGRTPQQPARDLGISLASAASNVGYFPVRLAVTLVTGVVGGLSGWLNGGDQPAANAVWNSTDGQAYVSPAMLTGRETFRFGSQPCN